MARLGKSRSGSERFTGVGPLLELLFGKKESQMPPPTPGEATVEDEPAADDPVDEATGLRRSMVEEQKACGDALDTQIAEKRKELREMEKKRAEEAAGQKGVVGPPDPPAGRNRRVLDDPSLKVVVVPYSKGAHEETCKACGGLQKVLRHQQRKWLEYVPGHFQVNVMEVPVTVCACGCAEATLTSPTPPPLILDGGMVGNSIVSHTITSKFCDILPLNRQVGILARQSVELAEATLRHGYTTGLRLLHDTFAAPLAKAVFASSLIQLDPTGFRVLDPRNCPGSSHKGTITGFIGDRTLALMVYDPSASPAAVIWPRLKGFAGKLLCDGTNHMNRLFNGIVATAMAFLCNSHSRRKFMWLAQAGDAAATWVTEQYRQIFRVETLADLQNLHGEDRAQLRREMTRPRMERIRDFLESRVLVTPPTEPFPKAARYFIRRFDGLTRFIDHGEVPPDNNASENFLRVVRLLENNSLFAGDHESAARHATAWSLMKNCALEHINPFEWLTDVFNKIAAGWPAARVAELLPHNWKRLHLTLT